MSYVGAPTTIYQRSDSNKGTQTVVSVTESPPSYPTRDMKSKMEDDQRTVQTGEDHKTAPTNSNIRPLGVSLPNESGRSVSNTNSVKPLTRSAAAGDRIKSSKPSLGVAASKYPATLGNLARIGESEESTETDPKINKQEDVGITVAGEKFRNVNPTAYYKAKINLI